MPEELARTIATEKFQIWLNRVTIPGVAGWVAIGDNDPKQNGLRITVDRKEVVDLFINLHPSLQQFRNLFAKDTDSFEVNLEAWRAELQKVQGACQKV